MFKKISVSLMFACAMCSFSSFADEFALLREERIGNLRIGFSEGEVQKTIHCQLKRGPEEFWGADAAYHQEWEYVGCGITLDMISEAEGASKSIESISVVSPSGLNTKQGIRIGSTEKEVMKAYKPYWNKGDSGPRNFVAGSLYGGLMFHFESGKVVAIFLGAAAE